MKNLLNTNKVQKLSKEKQQSIIGGCPASAKADCEARGGVWTIIPDLADCGYCDCSGGNAQ